MLTATQQATLAAFADRVIPADDTPGGAAAGAVAFVEDLLARELVPRAAEYTAFLDQLAAAQFTTLTASDQDALLETLETSPIFRLAAETIHEAYWTSPDGKQAVGFTERG